LKLFYFTWYHCSHCCPAD